MTFGMFLLAGIVAFALLSAVRVFNEYERGVVFRLGNCLPEPIGPGLAIVLPFGIDRVERVDLRTITMDVPAQEVITRDNVSVRVNAVVYFQVVEPRRALLEVEHFYLATSQLSQTTLRSVCGEQELDALLTKRDEVNRRLQDILDKHTDPWGVKVSLVEVKEIDLPQEMKRAMAKQAEAERERRAKIIHAQGELEAAERLAEAAVKIDRAPAALQLRYLQTLTEIATENNSTLVFPVPIDILNNLAGKKDKA